MAELGHPVIGPQSMWKLTHGEMRIYAEGLKRKADRKEAAQSGGSTSAGQSVPDYDESRKQRADDALAQAEQYAET